VSRFHNKTPPKEEALSSKEAMLSQGQKDPQCPGASHLAKEGQRKCPQHPHHKTKPKTMIIEHSTAS